MSPGTLLQMSLKDGTGLHVLQTKFTKEQLWKASVFLNMNIVINCRQVLILHIFKGEKFSEIFYS